jgi:DNA-directed RNA polymerase subunit F
VSVAEIGALHGRFIRQSDRFKSAWTYHQFATGAFRNFLDQPLPYSIDFQRIYERLKTISGSLNSAQMEEANDALRANDAALDGAQQTLLAADDLVPPSLVRRFFEKLKRTDDAIIHHLIKFYFYAQAIDGDRRDKIDFLFTRIGEDFSPDREEYWSRDSMEFREKIIALVSSLHVSSAAPDEVVKLIRAVRSMRDEVERIKRFEELTERHLLRNARLFKHRIGDLYFHPDVLLALVELNVATKNTFVKLYLSDEQRLVDDSRKLMEHGTAIARNFGDTNPELVEEIARFREAKERFDELRSQSNVKHDVVTRLKSTMTNILSQLDRGLEEDVIGAEIPAAFFDSQKVAEHFGRDETLLPHLTRLAASIADDVRIAELRLEPWEVAAFAKLFGRLEPEAAEDNEELWTLYARAAAVRVKVDEEANVIATSIAAGVRPEPELLSKAKQSLDYAKELDELFGEFLHEAVYYSNPKFLHQLYRSRFRLLRGFSGLWLIYDRQN